MNLHLEYKFNRGTNSNHCIVFLHGWGMNKNCFESIIQKIGCPCDILTLDFFGFGKSSYPIEYFDTYEYAYRVYVLLNKLNIKNVILVGHSFGGRVALILSSIFDINIHSQVLTSSAGINVFNLKKEINIFNYKLCKFLVKHNLIDSKILLKFGSDDFKNCNQSLKSVFVKVVNQDLKKHIKKIQTKTILVWDKKDKVTSFKIAKILRKYIANSNIITYGIGGHFAYLYNLSKFSQVILDLKNGKNL